MANEANAPDKIFEIIQQVNENVLYEHVKTIQDFGPHETGSQECEAIGQYIFNEFKSYGLKVEYDEWKNGRLEGKNVVATLEGKSNATVIISAHYDSADNSPGADDDGSGVSVVLMTAFILSQYEFNNTIKFITFSGEEEGSLGSKHYARKAYEQGEEIIAVLNLDCVGYAVSKDGGSKVSILAGETSKWIADVSEEICKKYDNLINLGIVRYPNRPYSDHQSFLDYGYEAIFYFEHEWSSYYNSPEDTIEHINASYLAKVCRLSVATLAKLADTNLDPIIRIVSPERGSLYVAGRKILSFPNANTIILGKIYAKAEVKSNEEINRVEFYFDGEIDHIEEEEPYEHVYDNIAFFSHSIKTMVYTSDGKYDMNKIYVKVFNVFREPPPHY